MAGVQHHHLQADCVNAPWMEKHSGNNKSLHAQDSDPSSCLLPSQLHHRNVLFSDLAVPGYSVMGNYDKAPSFQTCANRELSESFSFCEHRGSLISESPQPNYQQYPATRTMSSRLPAQQLNWDGCSGQTHMEPRESTVHRGAGVMTPDAGQLPQSVAPVHRMSPYLSRPLTISDADNMSDSGLSSSSSGESSPERTGFPASQEHVSHALQRTSVVTSKKHDVALSKDLADAGSYIKDTFALGEGGHCVPSTRRRPTTTSNGCLLLSPGSQSQDDASYWFS